MNCDFIQSGDYCVCTRPECQRRVKKSDHPCDKHHARCKLSDPPHLYLGDRVERWLSRIGITTARIKAVKKRLGFKPTCGCQWRKEFLNRLDRWVRRLW